jgi:hypothetical protein
MSDDPKISAGTNGAVGDDGESAAGSGPGDPSSDRREFVKKLAKAAVLPALVAAFVASEATDAAASL